MTLPSYISGLLQTKANRVMRNKLTATLEKFSITMPEWALLGNLYESKEGKHLASIADVLQVEPPLVTTMVDHLEKKGFVERKSDLHDRRAKLIFISEKGKEIVPEVEKSMQATLAKLLNNLSYEDLDAYRRVLEVIVKNAQDSFS